MTTMTHASPLPSGEGPRSGGEGGCSEVALFMGSGAPLQGMTTRFLDSMGRPGSDRVPPRLSGLLFWMLTRQCVRAMIPAVRLVPRAPRGKVR